MQNAAKIALLLLAPLLLLGIVGFAYSHWDDLMAINGAVSTGYVDAHLSIEGVWDIDQDHPYGGLATAYFPSPPPSDVVDTYGVDFASQDKIVFNVSNAYPGYEAWLWFNVHNNGTLPVEIEIQSINVTLNAPAALKPYISFELWYDQDRSGTISIQNVKLFYWNGTTLVPYPGQWSVVLNPCSEALFLLKIDISDNLNLINSSETYENVTDLITFRVELNAVQALPSLTVVT